MPPLTSEGQRVVEQLAQSSGFSPDSVTHMLVAVLHGNGSMAQFGHPEFGGNGQWMRGGMLMVGDMFNSNLKARVDSLCNDIANILGRESGQSTLFIPDPQANWWPAEFGAPSATGSQNNLRYAYFAGAHRLAVDSGGDVWVYDTLDHQIGGFAQQQGSGTSIVFSSQYGTVVLSSLPVVSRNGQPV